ncbi:hypothetical protein [Litchfieldia alkalitelluris]|uniref:hypothetical protein n=1 Tax=Litchfieldia alkalitelluris TaxID=304268 RepID=UPI00195DF962|nr:hypothetical protein [Litchfieldia alkalitelluris]
MSRLTILNYDDQIQLITHWLRTTAIKNVEGSVNKDIIRYQLRMEFGIESDEVVDEVYDSIIN